MTQDIDARRSTAAQFFMEDDSEEQKSSYNKIVDWLNHAAVATENKVDYLRKVQEIIINKEESLLDNFLEEVLGFQNDRSQDVRKFIVGFIEEACKKDPDVLPRVVTNLAMLLKDQSIQVQKRVVQAACSVYRSALAWLSHARGVTDEMEATWNIVCAIKGQIFGLVDSDNDGLRTQAIKLLESVVLMQTYPEPDSLRRDNDFSLEDVPLTLKIARRRKLEEEAHMVFELMLKFHGSMHISSVNLMTCMGSIALVAKMRPQFMGKVVNALETLNANLPPTLSKSQVSSVRKHLKLQLLNLLRLPSSVPFHNNITTMLTDLGASTQEVMRCLPRVEELRRRQKRLAAAAKADANAAAAAAAAAIVAGGPPVAKRPRLDAAATAAAAVGDDDEYDEDDDDETSAMVSVVMAGAGASRSEVSASVSNTEDGGRPLRPAAEQAVDITEQFIVERLSPEMAAQLVMVSMTKLPDTMPPHFSSMYTPIAAAGTQSQIRHVARLMASQLTALGLGPGFSRQLVKSAVKGSLLEEEEEEGPPPPGTTKASIASALSGIMEKDKEASKASSLMTGATSSKPTKQRIRTLKLPEITKPLDPEVRGTMLSAAVRRVLRSERPALLGGVAAMRNKIITTLAATYDDLVRREVLQFLLEDVRGRLELALAWLYEEYAFLQGFNRMPAFMQSDPDGPERSYNELLCSLASHLIEKQDARDRDVLLTRLYLEAPLITEDATDLLRTMCTEESRAAAGLALLRELVTRRPPRQLVFLNALLVHTAHENSEIRSKAISSVVALYDRGDLRCIIEEYAILYLGFLRLPAPPEMLFGPERGRPLREHVIVNSATGQISMGLDGNSGWSEEMVRACLYLYLALLPVNEKLIHELARVYVTTVADVKRTILRLLEQPVRGMGMDSPELLRLVEECPKGAETLVTRVIHILTDKTPPSSELVARVRDLYHSRVADVRFLIPVLNGLTKKEVVAALPKLIKLNPVVVKEVFNRLLGTHNEASSHTSPLTPAELLIALHTIDPSKCELKTIIKATSLCFAERQAYTQEVLAVVMQHLMELNPLPTLLMRTVIQALSFYPRLIGFVMNILQRLILKQVWKQRKVWEGFVKCCQRTRPQSFQVLLQLPPAQLCDVFEASPDLRAPLLQHVMSFTENQRAHIPPSIMDVLLGKRRTVTEEYDEQVEPRSPSELTIDIKEDPETEPAPPGME